MFIHITAGCPDALPDERNCYGGGHLEQNLFGDGERKSCFERQRDNGSV